MLVAKATYKMTASDEPELDTEDPYPIFLADHRTELGLLPRDEGLPHDRFEVIMLGVAHARAGRPTTRAKVTLSIGAATQEMLVFGDRRWTSGPDGWRATEPRTFQTMPLTWERAFGGKCSVEIDDDAWLELAEPRNPAGTGFDPTPQTRWLADELRCPPGYPRCEINLGLPNLEDPSHPISERSSSPIPWCWATVPFSSGLHAERCGPGKRSALREALRHRAHPDWVIDRPEMHAQVRLEGLSQNGTITFHLPALRIIFDYVIGDRTGRRELTPQSLVLLPEERRFYVVYRRAFGVTSDVGSGPRAMRIRLARGWPRPSSGGPA